MGYQILPTRRADILGTSPAGVGIANPVSVPPGSNTLLTVTVTPGTDPPSISLVVTGNLAAIDGSAAQAFALAGSNVFTFLATIGPDTRPA